MLKRLALALLVCAGSAHALNGRDLDGNGTIDAYYDAGQNLTWLAHPFGGGHLRDFEPFNLQLEDQFGFLWRLPRLLDFTTPLEDCQLGNYLGNLQLVIAYCFRPHTPDSSELSKSGLPIGAMSIWADGSGMIATDPRLPGQTFDMTPIFRAGTDLFVFDPMVFTASFWPVVDGDRGVAVAQIPEPETWVLMLAGLLLLHIGVWPKPVLKALTIPFRKVPSQFLRWKAVVIGVAPTT